MHDLAAVCSIFCWLKDHHIKELKSWINYVNTASFFFHPDAVLKMRFLQLPSMCGTVINTWQLESNLLDKWSARQKGDEYSDREVHDEIKKNG